MAAIPEAPEPVDWFEFDHELGEEGRLQFFFHSPDSDYPVRDVLGKEKTEPYIEENAENYCNECYQSSIQSFLDNNKERYLFLFTNRSGSRNALEGRHIVGYIEKERKLIMENHDAVQGRTVLVDFDNAFRLRKLESVDSPRYTRVETLDQEATEDLVTHFDNQPNIIEECKGEIERLKDVAREQNNEPETSTEGSNC